MNLRCLFIVAPISVLPNRLLKYLSNENFRTNSVCSSETLLTYVQVAKANTALSVANFNAALAVPAALGLDPSAARSRFYSL